MKTMKKIVAILAVALMLCSILPLSVFAAAGDTYVVNFSSISGSVQYADETHDLGGGISLHITKCHINTQLRIYSSASNNGIATFTSEEPIASFVMNAGNKADTVNVYTSTDGSTWTLDQGVAVASTYKDYTVELAAPSKYIQLDVAGTQQVRIAKMTFTFGEEAAAGCDHASLVCGETCSNCGEFTKEHKFSNACVEVCENDCGTANPDYVAGHSYAGAYDATCDICNAVREVSFPADGSTLTIAQIIEICASMDSGATTSEKYYVAGEITEIYNTTYGNMYITDGENTLTIYGTYDATGTNRFDAMAEQPEVGNTVTLYGKIGPYNGTAQMQYANITEIVSDCSHEYEFECSTTCKLCGKGLRDAACVNDNPVCIDGLCIYCGGDVAGLGHGYDSDYDADCNYCGEIREVPDAPVATEQTLDLFATTGTLAADSSVITWQSENYQFANYKSASTTAIRVTDADHYRIYAHSKVVVSGLNGEVLSQIKITATSEAYATVLGGCVAEGWEASVDGTVVTFTATTGAANLTIEDVSAQVRVNSVTITPAATGSEDCAHEYDNACDADCNLCGAIRVIEHAYVETIVDATCTAAGSKTYTCSVCGDSYSEEIPMIPHNYVDGTCSACGAELPLEATITFDANKTQRVEYSTEIQKWEHDGLVLVNNKATSTSSVGDYSNPGRFYKDSEIVISFPGMTSLTIDASGVESKYLWDTTLADYAVTVADGIYTITFAEPTDSITLTAANQVRANTITASAVQAGCAHEYDNACDVDCNLCYEAREVQHSVQHVEAVAATCAANGNIEYWYCDVCGMAWLDADCIMNTNLRAVVLPATGEHTYDNDQDADCNVCGETREVATVIYGDANGDGSVNARDAALLQQYVAGWDAAPDMASADANGDGSVNARDAALLQQYVAGWDVTLGA